jgi:hypothetical protein
MKKTARYFLVLLALSGVATAFADVGDHTKPSGGRVATVGK